MTEQEKQKVYEECLQLEPSKLEELVLRSYKNKELQEVYAKAYDEVLAQGTKRLLQKKLDKGLDYVTFEDDGRKLLHSKEGTREITEEEFQERINKKDIQN